MIGFVPGYLPSSGAINTEGLENPVDMEELFRLPKEFWIQEAEAIGKFYDEQVQR